MTKKLTRLFGAFAAVATLTLTGCLKMEHAAQLNSDNSGKALVKMAMINPMAMLGGGQGGPPPEDMAKEIAKGIIGGSEGVDVWKDVSYGVRQDGMLEFQGTAYFSDFTQFSAGSGDEMGSQQFKSAIENGTWVIEMDLAEPEAKEGEDAPKQGEPVDMAQIEAQLQQQRMQWQAMKGMMGAFFNEIEMKFNLEVGGEIQESNGFEKSAPNAVGFNITGQKIMAGMDKLIMDDELMKKALAEGNVGEDGMPEPTAEMISKMFFGTDGPLRMEIKPGKDLFDYEKEVADAKANMPEETKALIKEAEESGAEAGAFPF